LLLTRRLSCVVCLALPDGLPHTRIGNRILIHIPTAREWLFARMRHPNRRRHSNEPQPRDAA